MREEVERKRYVGIKANPKYAELKSVMLNNKIKTHEYQENSKSNIFGSGVTFYQFRKNHWNQKE